MKMITKTFKYFVIFLAVLAYTPVFANTTYQTELPTSEQMVDFPYTPTNDINSTPNYFFAYRLPSGVLYDRIQISVPENQDIMTGMTFGVGNIPVDHEPWNCLGSNCYQNPSFLQLTINSNSRPQLGTIQYIFSTTTNSTLRQDFEMLFDPNPPEQDVFYNGTSEQLLAVAMNGYNYSKSYIVPSIKFCNGPCDNNTFNTSGILNLTANPWARFISPANNAYISYTNPSFSVQINTGTTTPTHGQINFNSNYQDLIPVTFDINSSGLTSYTFNQPFPPIDDDITATVSLWNGTTTLLFESDPYTFHLRETASVGGVIEDIPVCDQYNAFLGGICSIFEFLFVPSDGIFTSFNTVWDGIKNKPPFGYISAIIDEITNIDSNATPAFDFGVIPFSDAIFSPLRGFLVLALWLLYAVYFFHRVTRLPV